MSDESRVSQYVQRGQEQARTAWSWVDQAVKDRNISKERYATLARKLPSLLQVSGLGQTLAFLYASAKTDKAESLLREQLGNYLSERLRSPKKDVMEMVVGFSPSEYRQATRELMLVADWLKRFSEGRLGKGSD